MSDRLLSENAVVEALEAEIALADGPATSPEHRGCYQGGLRGALRLVRSLPLADTREGPDRE